VLTDWLIIRRLGAELDKRLRGARIRSVGMLADGRFGLRTPAGVLAFDAFGELPLVLLERDQPLSPEPGWPRAVADALEGLKIERIRARRGDRLIALDAASRSRFGVVSQSRLVAELVPRFGNLVLLKGDMVVAAAKSFEKGGRTLRTVTQGEPYEAPPLPARRELGPGFEDEFAALADGHSGEPARKRAAKALRAAEPLLPLVIADSFVAEAASVPWASAAVLVAWLRAKARALITATEGEPEGLGDVFGYFDGGRLLQAHVLPLYQFAAAPMGLAPVTERRSRELVPLLADAANEKAAKAGNAGFTARREVLRSRVAKRRAALAAERAALEADRADDSELERLRSWGDLLYAHAPDVPPRARDYEPPTAPGVTIALDPELDAKANAAAIFKRYRKSVGKRAHAERRLAQLESEERALDALAWEVDRAVPETVEELRAAVDALDRRKAPKRVEKGQPRGKRGPLEVALGEDVRAFVGRSPTGNAELTFRVARPDDLWFHARNIPGAHVVLRLDAAREPSDAEVRAAAALAAFHSKAGSAEKVEVDYTRRKFVRKQAGGAPGLVWYTNARTLLVAPRDPAVP
jgi:predicted ribosome quality control (RQC) complex YloA/Tae2 family protein